MNSKSCCKRTILLGLLLLFNFLAVGMYGQKLTINLQNVPVKDVLKTISNQTQIKFVYTDVLNIDKIVSVNANNKSIDAFLKDFLSHLGLILREKVNM